MLVFTMNGFVVRKRFLRDSGAIPGLHRCAWAGHTGGDRKVRISLQPPEYRPNRWSNSGVLVAHRGNCRSPGDTGLLGWNYLTSNNQAETLLLSRRAIAVYDPAMAELEGLEAFIAKVRQWEKEVEEIRGLYPPHQEVFWAWPQLTPGGLVDRGRDNTPGKADQSGETPSISGHGPAVWRILTVWHSFGLHF